MLLLQKTFTITEYKVHYTQTHGLLESKWICINLVLDFFFKQVFQLRFWNNMQTFYFLLKIISQNHGSGNQSRIHGILLYLVKCPLCFDKSRQLVLLCSYLICGYYHLSTSVESNQSKSPSFASIIVPSMSSDGNYATIVVNLPKPWRVLIPSFQLSFFCLLPITPFNFLLL